MGRKIQKNRSDSDMMQGYVEERSFEHQWLGESTPQPRPTVGRKGSKSAENESFLPVKTREELEKSLVAIKLELYKEGVQEYHLQVKRAGNSVTLTVAPGKG